MPFWHSFPAGCGSLCAALGTGCPENLPLCAMAQRECPYMSPPEGHRGACAPPAWSWRSGSAQALFWFFTQKTACPCAKVLCPGAAAPSGITVVLAGLQPAGLPATQVPSSASPGQGAPAASPAGQGGGPGATHLARGSHPLSPGTTDPLVCGTSTRLRGWELPAAAQGFQTLLIFPLPMCRRVGTGWTKPSPGGEVQQGPGHHACVGTAAPVGEREHGCGGDFPVNIWEGDGTASGFLIIPPAPPSPMSMRGVVLHTMENSSPSDGEEPSRGAAGTVPGWQVGPKSPLQRLSRRDGGGEGLPGAELPAQRAADLPLGQVVATAGRKVRFPAGGCRG